MTRWWNQRWTVIVFCATLLNILIMVSPAPTGAAEPTVPAMGFFVTSRSVGTGDLGGLEGADRHCQMLATEAGVGHRTWRAYLSAGAQGKRPVINARDRIGRGPWRNATGVVIARDLEELHSDLNQIDQFSALDEHGQRVRQYHDMLTGSDANGRLAFVNGIPATCGNWTSKNGIARIGHHDRLDPNSFENPMPRWNGSWNSVHNTLGCDTAQLNASGGRGQFYCFAVDAQSDAAAERAEAVSTTQYTFKRGLNIDHWLGNNLPPESSPNSLYGEDWFDAEDVAWIAAQGFDHLRIQVGGHNWIKTNGRLDLDKIARFDAALGWAKSHGLGVVLTLVSFPGFRAHLQGEPSKDDDSLFKSQLVRDEAAYSWWLVARHYAAAGPELRFEILNQPKAEDAASLQSFNRSALAEIRKTNPTRIVYLTSHDASLDAADEVDLNDPNTALAVDFSEPMLFTSQVDAKLPRIQFPGRVPDLQPLLPVEDERRRASNTELSVANLDARIDNFATQMAGWRGSREIYVNSFGVHRSSDDVSASNYVRAARAAFERNGIAWAIYDYHTGYAVRGADGQPTRIMKALVWPADFRSGQLRSGQRR
jgi:endoglucanase